MKGKEPIEQAIWQLEPRALIVKTSPSKQPLPTAATT
jgi:hypothetical protein